MLLSSSMVTLFSFLTFKTCTIRKVINELRQFDHILESVHLIQLIKLLINLFKGLYQTKCAHINNAAIYRVTTVQMVCGRWSYVIIFSFLFDSEWPLLCGL